jgi:ribosomal protein S18 acetylase RimI-like enzyme
VTGEGGITIRPFRAADAEAVRRNCIEAGWAGVSADSFLGRPEIWAEFWTSYYLRFEPGSCLVATDPFGEVVGYLTGTYDSHKADGVTARRILPGLALHILAGGAWLSGRNCRFFARASRAACRGQLSVPESIQRAFPAHFHLNVAGRARGAGVGRRLHERFIEKLKRSSVSGLHCQVLGSNEVVLGFLARRGYNEIHRVRAPSLDGLVDNQPVELVTLARVVG